MTQHDADLGAEEVGEDRVLPPPRDDTRVSRRRNLIGWVFTIIVAVGFTLIVRTWVFQAYSIPSTSMVPTLEVSDRVVVSKLNRDPGRGDIVVFDRPVDDPAAPGEPSVLIKRVIGLPGETIDAVDGQVRVDGHRLEESYLPAGVTTEFEHPIEVGRDEILVLGDNRSVSKDGRVFGPVKQSSVIGRAIFRIWPLSRLGSL